MKQENQSTAVSFKYKDKITGTMLFWWSNNIHVAAEQAEK